MSTWRPRACRWCRRSSLPAPRRESWRAYLEYIAHPKAKPKYMLPPTCGRYAAGRWADDPRPFLEVNLLSRSRIGRGHLGWQASLLPPTTSEVNLLSRRRIGRGHQGRQASLIPPPPRTPKPGTTCPAPVCGSDPCADPACTRPLSVYSTAASTTGPDPSRRIAVA